jgi:hypothetical protein
VSLGRLDFLIYPAMVTMIMTVFGPTVTQKYVHFRDHDAH